MHDRQDDMGFLQEVTLLEEPEEGPKAEVNKPGTGLSVLHELELAALPGVWL